MTPIQCANAPATAHLFVRLCMRPRSGRARASASILDVLIPRTAARACTTRATTPRAVAGTFKNAQSSRWQGRAVGIARGSRVTAQSPQRRGFGTSLPRRRTEAIFNPQHDEDGKEMVLGIAPGAAKRLSEIMARDSNPLLALRIAVESGGCHGFQYLMSLVTLPPELPSSAPAATVDGGSDGKTIQEDDTIFAYQADESGEKASLTAPKIILDGPSLELLQGSKVDFTMELIGSQFKIVDNPHATSSCGCGTSFDIKV